MNFNKRFFVFGLLMTVIFLASCDYQPYKQGRNLYNFYCATCHMDKKVKPKT